MSPDRPNQVNLGNLNIHFGVPIFSRPGRGIPFSYVLSYDSSVWYPSGGSWLAKPNFECQGQTEIATGYLEDRAATSRCSGTGIHSGLFLTTYSGFKYHDSFGVTHRYGGVAVDRSSCPSGVSSDLNARTQDGSGYSVHYGAVDGTYWVFAPTGQQFIPPLNVSTGSGSTTDRNGNQISVSSGGVFTDTLGSTALSISGTNPVVYAYTDGGGNARNVSVNYGPHTVKTWNCYNEYAFILHAHRPSRATSTTLPPTLPKSAALRRALFPAMVHSSARAPSSDQSGSG